MAAPTTDSDVSLAHASAEATDQADVGGAPVVVVDDLHVVYETRGRKLHAVRGVKFEVARGEILALVGESGSGKSSIAMALLALLQEGAGLSTSVSGSVSVLGTDMLNAPGDVRRAVRRDWLGAVFQDPMTSLNPTMTIGQQLMEVARTAERAEALLDSVGVSEAKLRLRSYPHELSGGQRQRVMIAMAIARDPALIVADEPTTALDVTIQAQILEMIRKLRKEIRCAFVIVTHDLGVAAQVADRIAVCYLGRIVEIGSATELLSRPKHPYTSALIKARITLHSDRLSLLPTIIGEPPDPHKPPPGCPFAPRCEHARSQCDAAVPSLEIVDPSGHHSACVRVREIDADLVRELSTGGGGKAHPPDKTTTAVPVVRVSGIEKTFKVRAGRFERTNLPALRGIDLDVGQSECVALVGESGCGKSTLLRALAGLLGAECGTIEYGAPGRPQMVFQDAGSSLTPWLTVGEQINERLRCAGLSRGEAATRMESCLERLGLPLEIVRRRPGQLSGGQRQRVALARAIVLPPPLLLCDEPTSSLDVSLAATVLNLLQQLREELGMAMLFVTHDLAAARFVADRIAVMHLGRVVETGPTDEVIERPAHPYTEALLSAVPDLGRQLAPPRGELPSPLRLPAGCTYQSRCPVALPQCKEDDQFLRPLAGKVDHQAACVHIAEQSQ